MTNKEAAQALKNFNNLIEADRLINELGSIVQGSHAHILIKRVIVDMAEAQTTTEALTDHGKAEGEHHCTDCCCAKSWQALGITEYTGKSIPEHIAELKASQTPQTVDVEALAHSLEQNELKYTFFPIRETIKALASRGLLGTVAQMPGTVTIRPYNLWTASETGKEWAEGYIIAASPLPKPQNEKG